MFNVIKTTFAVIFGACAIAVAYDAYLLWAETGYFRFIGVHSTAFAILTYCTARIAGADYHAI